MVTCNEIYASARALFMIVISLNGTSGGNVPYNRIPSVGDAVGRPGTVVGVAEGFDVNAVAVTNVAVRSTRVGTRVGVSESEAGEVGGAVTVGLARTGVAEGRGDGMGDGGACVVTITAVGVARPGIGSGKHAPKAIKITKAGIIFLMASPLSIRID